MNSEDAAKREHDAEATRAEPRPPTRRQFLAGLTSGTVAIGAVSPAEGGPAVPPPKTRGATDTTTVCPFCGVGCGQVVSTRSGKVINIEGDPGHPISEGTLCSKGAAAIQVVNNPRRLQKVLYRAPRGTAWEEKSWVPFEQVGYITGLPKAPMPDLTHRWLRVTPHVFAVLYGLLAALTWIVHRRIRRRGHDDEKT
jgi:Molybdopterin oxidoreductase Fe4S4 domain